MPANVTVEQPDESLPPDRPLAGGLLLAAVGAATMSAFRAALAPHGIHPRQFAVLKALAEASGRSQRELSQLLHIPPSRLVALVDDLEGRGLVERRPHPTDRRTRSLHLTDSGRALLATLVSESAAHEERLFAHLSDDERRELDRLLLRLADALGLGPGGRSGVHDDDG